MPDGLTKSYFNLKTAEGSYSRLMSSWHGLEFSASTQQKYHVTGVIEVTKGTRAKFEMSKETVSNPIFSDVNLNKDTGAKQLRKYGVAPIFNYGFIPQTWEDNRNMNGDGDPIDLCDIGQHKDTGKPIMAVCDYLVLGCLGLIDQKEIDYKVLAIEINEALADDIKTMDDFVKKYPGKIEEIKNWFRDIKTYDGKAPNTYMEGVDYFDADETWAIIHECHLQYRTLFSGDFVNKGGYWLGINE